MAQGKARRWPYPVKRTRPAGETPQQQANEWSEMFEGVGELVKEAEAIHGVQPPSPHKGSDPTPVPSRVLKRVSRLLREASEAISPYI